MARNERLENLRAQARARHKAATRKVSRLKTNNDVEISGTKLDPRRDLANLKRYNAKQLESYIGKLDSFVSRETSYVAGARRKPLPGNLWHTYESLENALRRKNAKPFEQVKDVFVPSLGMTVEQFHGAKPTHPVTGNPSSRAPHIVNKRSPKGIPNEKQLNKLIKNTREKLNPDYDEKVFKRDKKVARKMLTDIGKVTGAFIIDGKRVTVASMKRDIGAMSKDQFNFLWNNTNFADIASFDYEIAKSKLHDKKALAQFDSAFDTQLRVMHSVIGDVKSLPSSNRDFEMAQAKNPGLRTNEYNRKWKKAKEDNPGLDGGWSKAKKNNKGLR